MSRLSAAPSRARLVDVARLAGVSRQTVSNVVNGRGSFSEETRSRVQAAIDQLSFQPNRTAQGLRSNRTLHLGFDISRQQLEVTNPFTISFLHELVCAAAEHDYRVVAFAHKHETASDFRSTVAAGGVDGFVLSDSSGDDGRARVLAEAEVPFVVFGRTPPDLPQNWVDIDNREAMAAPIDHLVGTGRRTFGYLGYPLREYWNRDRHAGARDRLRHHGLDLEPDATITGSLEELQARARQLLQNPDRPDALITSSDSIAITVVNIATSLGLQVGRELAVTGFDAGPLRTMVEPNLTSVRIPVDRIANALIDRLMSELRGNPGEPGECVPTDLVLGAST